MSDMGAIADAVISSAVSAVTTLTAANSERQLRLTDSLNTEQFPHLFSFNPEEVVEVFPYLQERSTVTIDFALVTRHETEETVSGYLDDIRDKIRCDQTLGGIVRWSYVSTRGIRQHPERPERAGDFSVVAISEGGSPAGVRTSDADASGSGTLIGQIATAVEAQVSGIERMSSDYRDDLEAILAGETRYQLRVGPSGEDSTRSSGPRGVSIVELAIHHQLEDPNVETDWTTNDMQHHVETLIAASWWRALAKVYEVEELPSYEVEREINVITTTITVEVSLNP